MTNTKEKARKVFAYCWQTGQIGFGESIPRGTIKLTCGDEERLRLRVAAVARLAYDNETLLVPGVPEATNGQTAMERVWEFIERLEERIVEKEAA